MSASLTKISASRTIARPLRVLVPLIQDDLERATSAGLPYYIAAGEKLIEARSQLSAHESWLRWLHTHFSLSRAQAYRYMAAAEQARDMNFSSDEKSTLEALTGEKERRKQSKQKKQKAWSRVHAALDDVDIDAVKQDRQTERDEITLHRDLALEMIDIGFKTLATRLHPDRGGSDKHAMARLNRVRAVLKEVAETRRFV